MNTHIKSCAIVALTASCTLLGSHVALGQTITLHVDIESEATTPDGLSWATAFPFLQDGLEEAKLLIDFDPNVSDVDIWVAAGVYKPDHDSNNPDGTCVDFGDGWFQCNTAAKFSIPSKVRIFGGFVGTETSLDERNGGVHDPTLTILTGDLADGASDPNSAFEAYSESVVTFEDADSTARLDTVTVKRGWIETVLFDTSSAILSNSIITESAATAVNVKGAGVPRMINCQFIHNQGFHDSAPSGALTIQTGADATVVNSLFYNNHSFESGAAVRVLGQGITLLPTTAARMPTWMHRLAWCFHPHRPPQV